LAAFGLRLGDWQFSQFNDFNVYGRSFEPSRFCGTGPPSGPDVCTSRPNPRLKRRR
jgi:hypothetical protein